METVQVKLGERSYSILIGSSFLQELGNYLTSLIAAGRVFLVTNEIVGRLYGELARGSLEKAGFRVLYKELPDGEEFKSFDSAYDLYTCAIEGGIERQSAVIALGGGVIGDLAGFVAATYMRGVVFVQVPTTLLAQVDSSVGGKVAVNHPLGKNIIGCFYQPRLVFTDVSTLKTLPARELRSGIAEVIKYGVIWDEGFFSFLEKNLEKIYGFDQDVLVETVKRSCEIKVKIVECDETEQGIRAILNFGHTVGHALETLTGYKFYRHGEAVAAGIMVAATIAAQRGIFPEASRERLFSLLRRAGLTVPVSCDPEQIFVAVARDKKVVNGCPRFVLPAEIGRVEIFSDVERDEFRLAFEKCFAKGSGSM